MLSPEPQADHARLEAEARRIVAAYARRRDDLYSWFSPGHLFLMQSREREVLRLLKSLGLNRLARQRILEVGCGDGLWLGELIKWGARPEHLCGLDLRADILAVARANLPAETLLIQANAAFLPFSASTFDLVLQSLVFTSILDPLMKQVAAGEMLRVLKPGGFILWYDYCVNNPANPDVRGVSKGEIRRLFPDCQLHLRRLSLAPPLARRLAPYSFLLCFMLEKLRFLNTHYLGIIWKPA
ncbi:MAG: class I SAM-dependent methyltransferase [Desulfobaccales bacterium]